MKAFAESVKSRVTDMYNQMLDVYFKNDQVGLIYRQFVVRNKDLQLTD